jgi:hypothetical protein
MLSRKPVYWIGLQNMIETLLKTELKSEKNKQTKLIDKYLATDVLYACLHETTHIMTFSNGRKQLNICCQSG